MDKRQKQTNDSQKSIQTLLIAIAATVTAIAIGVFAFLRFYNSYIDKVLYQERLSQMREVTTQLFNGLEDVVDSQWKDVNAFCNYVEAEKPADAETLQEFMQKLAIMNSMETNGENLVAVDNMGRYMTQDGWQGTLEEMDYLLDKPERVSFVSKSLLADESRMYFLKRLSEPVEMEENGRKIQVIYYGISQNMSYLNPYFSCSAYDNSNSVYVLNESGMRIFYSKENDLIKGYNAYTVLQKMEYLHDNSFEEAKADLEINGYGYANAVMNGEEYYYALYQMHDAEWTLLFLVPSSYVAVNVVSLVNTTVRMILLFAMILVVISAAIIFLILQVQKKKAVDAEKRNSERLSAALSAAERAEQKATKASRAKTDFLANMSHDIRTPMNAIVGLTSLMAHDKEDPKKIGVYIGKMQKSSQHLLSLINDVLDMSKIESGEVALNTEPISLPEQIEQIEGIVRPQTEEREQHFQICMHSMIHEHYFGDATRLRQVLLNLLSNAVKYTPNGGNIRMDFEERSCENPDYAKLCISVTDTGCGMTPEFMQHIFEPFTRAENSTTNRVQGTGLGMAITKNIVDLAGGTISIQSEINQGSCFTVELPLRIDCDAAGAGISAEGSDRHEILTESGEGASVLNGMRFLCAEDNALNAEILQAVLDMNGASCVIYPDGQKIVEAFASVKPGDFDAILMDVQMPVMNGLDATRAIRRCENPLGRTIPIIAMTANAFSEDVKNCLNAGMDAHVSKPLDISALERTIKSINRTGDGHTV